MDKSKLASVNVDVMSIENFATKEAAQIVEIDMTTPEYTADTCLMSDDGVSAMSSSEMMSSSEILSSASMNSMNMNSSK